MGYLNGNSWISPSFETTVNIFCMKFCVFSSKCELDKVSECEIFMWNKFFSVLRFPTRLSIPEGL